MRKLWNHYDQLDSINPSEEGELACPKNPPVSRKRPNKLFSWLFGGLENENALEDEAAAEEALHLQAESAEQRQKTAQVHRALQDWKAATAFFENVTEPELIDYAVYGMEAAQKRYIYLLKNSSSAKEQRGIPL